MEQAKLKVCWRKARSLLLVPGGSQPQALPFSPALLAMASECPVSLFFLLAVEWVLKVELILLLLFAHGISCMLVHLASLAGCPLKFGSLGRGLWFSDVFPAPQGPDKGEQNQ